MCIELQQRIWQLQGDGSSDNDNAQRVPVDGDPFAKGNANVFLLAYMLPRYSS